MSDRQGSGRTDGARQPGAHGSDLSSDKGPRRGLVVEDLHLRCEGCARGSVTAGLWSQGADVSRVQLRRCEIEGFDHGVDASQAAARTLAYNHFHRARTGGIAAGGPDLAVLHDRFEHNGCIDAISDDACAGGSSLFVDVTLRDSSTRIIGNEITRTAVDSQGKCRGVALQVNGGGYGARIERNYIHEPVDAIREGCGGIQAIANPDTAIGYCVGCSIQGNRIENRRRRSRRAPFQARCAHRAVAATPPPRGQFLESVQGPW